jgi:hypothetical protein
VLRADDPPTNEGGGGGGGSGTVATTTTLGNTFGTSYDLTNAISAVLSVKAGAAGKVTCSAPISFKRRSTSVAGTTSAAGKWQWRVPAGSWADIAAEVGGGNSQTQDLSGGEGGSPIWNTSTGSLSCTQTKTGLTPNADYEFRFVWRDVAVAGTASRVQRTAGTLQADGTVT